MPIPLQPLAVPASPHPLDLTDRPIIEALLAVQAPSDADIVNAARLHIRYRDSRLSPDLAVMLGQAMNNWNLSIEEINTMARAVWASGYRPQALDPEQQVGSGADVEG